MKSLSSRRYLLALATPALASGTVPTDEHSLNAFAQQYNTYAEQLRAGQIDLKQWARVVRAWDRLTK
jgi:hypothetical protein